MRQAISVLKLKSLKSIHNWILLLGTAFGLSVYFPIWLSQVKSVTISGIPHWMLNVLLIGLAFWQLHKQRLPQTETSIEDRWLGSSLVLGGIAFFYAYSSVVAHQALSIMVMIMLVGGVLSYRGWKFLRQQWFAIALLAASLHPNLERVARHLWYLFAPPQALSEFMAWASSWVLKAIGQPVSLQGQYVVLPAGSVEVAPGCDGFGMTFVIVIAAVTIGTVFRVRSQTMIQLIAIGVPLALTLNIFRIAVMVLAAVYWGQAAFEFWHGAVGGQVFSGILFTLYYYATQPILDLEDKRGRQ